MKTLMLTTCFIFALAIPASGQHQVSTPDSTKYVYCELVGISKLMSTKVTVSVDFGEHRKIFQDTRIRDEESGKIQSFNSMVDALNYMGEEGWEFVQAYVVTSGSQNVYRWLLKRPF